MKMSEPIVRRFGNTFVCGDCNHHNSSLWGARFHSIQKHPWRCVDCTLTFLFQYDLDHHRAEHHDVVTLYLCLECDYKAINSIDIELHHQFAHQMEDIQVEHKEIEEMRTKHPPVEDYNMTLRHII